MRSNKILAKMRAGEVAHGCQLQFASPTLVEWIGMAGFDFLYLDGEHGVFSYESVEDMCRVAELSGLTPIIRAPSIEPHDILRLLDRGVMGIVGPHISSAEDARRLVDACYYGPIGSRSMSAARGSHYGYLSSDIEYMEHANSQVLVVALIEDEDVLEQLDAVASTAGIHLYGVGEKDTAQSMGLPGQAGHPRVGELKASVADAVHRAGKMVWGDAVSVGVASKLFIDAASSHVRARTAARSG